jgi:hypothetical protein
MIPQKKQSIEAEEFRRMLDFSLEQYDPLALIRVIMRIDIMSSDGKWHVLSMN